MNAHPTKVLLKAAGNSIPLWVERDSCPAAWGIGHRALVCSFPCPMPNSQFPKTPSPCGWSFSFA
ncbi:hypothetical protein FDUTEX481_01375 [Tolypothrix sp. PCC 7601]|nr:hypothetical protein FDUTEX481_01375 [Tolypothrix sp. PCC 7601]